MAIKKTSSVPAKGASPTGIFSARGKQKKDPATAKYTGEQTYALSQSTRKHPVGGRAS